MTDRIITQEEIQAAVIRIAGEIDLKHNSGDMKARTRPIILLGVMNGSFRFLSDLSGAIDTPMRVETIAVQSYRGKQQENVVITHSAMNLDNHQVIIVEDIVDSGSTIAELKKYINSKTTGVEIEVCTLLNRKDNGQIPEFVGFEIKQGDWAIGYGMDDENGMNRNLDHVLLTSN